VSNLESIVKKYEEAQVETEITYAKLAEDIRLSQGVDQLSDFTPLKINTKLPKAWAVAVPLSAGSLKRRSLKMRPK